MSLSARQQGSGEYSYEAQIAVVHLIQSLFWNQSPPQSRIDLWNRQVVSRFPNLSYANLHDYLTRTVEGSVYFYDYGSTQGPTVIACNLESFNLALGDDGGGGGSGTLDCECVRDDCCVEGDDDCINYDPDNDNYDTDSDRSRRDNHAALFEKRTNEQIVNHDFIDPDTNRQYYFTWIFLEVG